MDNKTLKYIGCGVGVLVLIIILISCFGGKKLTCTAKDDEDKTSTKYVFHFKDGQADKLNVATTITFDDEEKAKNAEKNYNDNKKKDSDKVDYSVSRSGKKITVSITYKDAQTIKNMLDIDDLSEKSIKESASHDDDITCK